jgi:hypothetical protein
VEAGWLAYSWSACCAFSKPGPFPRADFHVDVTRHLILSRPGPNVSVSDSPEINSENLLVLLSPIVMVFGTGLFFLLLDQIEFLLRPFRSIAIAAFVFIASMP